VVAPVTHNKQGQLLNTNADTIAQEIAQSMSEFYEVHLIYSFEKAGVLLDINDESTVIRKLSRQYYEELKTPLQGKGAPPIFAGMVPKLDNAFAALNKGVHRVIIGKAEQLQDLITGKAGTSINHE
jgi:acetylglutamate kinase